MEQKQTKEIKTMDDPIDREAKTLFEALDILSEEEKDSWMPHIKEAFGKAVTSLKNALRHLPPTPYVVNRLSQLA